ncbi:MAG: 1-acyl-sn-glycerol-3-phosphate acyltransferase [Chitinophagales bacterium]|nr:1-acyl-sn-glycerol-3-phosphate acyltransferase [Chitinophagales bacterium]
MLKAFFKWYYNFSGWKLGNRLPEGLKKCVMVVAPHTSGWDFIYGMGANLHLELNATYLAKKELFKWPFKKMFLTLGGVPVDRGKKNKMTEAMVEYINTHEIATIVFPAEGTRKRVTKWKRGFYHVALGANVPIVLAYIDYKEKKAGIGPSFMPSGDIEKDFKIIAEFYKNITARNPENFAVPE